MNTMKERLCRAAHRGWHLGWGVKEENIDTHNNYDDADDKYKKALETMALNVAEEIAEQVPEARFYLNSLLDQP